MPRLHSTLLVALGTGSALTLFASSACGQGSAGFTSPARLSATAPYVDLDGAVIADTGRAAVLWREVRRSPGARPPLTSRYLVAVGQDPSHLAAPTELKAGKPFAAGDYASSLGTFPDGRLAACFQSDPRKG